MKKEMFCFLVLLLFISCGSQGISLGSGFLGNKNGNKSGGLWLMLSADKAYKSTNGESWSEASIRDITSTTGNFVGLAYGKENTTSNNYHWLALTRNDGYLFSSTDDGATWKRKGRVTNNDGTVVSGSFEDLATDGKGNWIALASNRIHKYGFSNSNSNNWPDSRLPRNTSRASGISYGNGLWGLVFNNGDIYKSSDGTTWEGPISPGTTNSIAYGNDIWTAVQNNGGLSFLSKDLGSTINSNYTNDTNDNTDFTDIAYGNGKWVAVRSASTPPIIFKATLVTNPNTVEYTAIVPTGIPTTPTHRFTTVAFRP